MNEERYEYIKSVSTHYLSDVAHLVKLPKKVFFE